MFNRGLANIEELERLEELERSSKVKQAAVAAPSIDEFFSSRAFLPRTLSWLDQALPISRTAAVSSSSS